MEDLPVAAMSVCLQSANGENAYLDSGGLWQIDAHLRNVPMTTTGAKRCLKRGKALQDQH